MRCVRAVVLAVRFLVAAVLALALALLVLLVAAVLALALALLVLLVAAGLALQVLALEGPVARTR